MLPIRDTIQSRSFPLVNWLLIGANALVFFIELGLSSAMLERLISYFGLVPARIILTNLPTLLPFISHMFLHGGWFHLISNIWVLYIFGDNVEDRLGSVRYLFFYLLGGIAAGLLQVQASPDSLVPTIGASGAVAAVMGAYFFFYPRARIITLIPVFFAPWVIQIPAIIYLGFWFISQLFSGLLSMGDVTMGGVAWWAHVGGFLFGLLMARPFSIGKSKPGYRADEYHPW